MPLHAGPGRRPVHAASPCTHHPQGMLATKPLGQHARVSKRVGWQCGKDSSGVGGAIKGGSDALAPGKPWGT